MSAGARAGARAAVTLLVAGAGALMLAGCSLLPGAGTEGSGTGASDGGAERTSESATPAQSSAAASDAGGSESPGAAAPAGPGQRCGEKDGWAVVIAQGSADCAAAAAVIADYEDTADIAPGGRPANPEQVQGWACEPIIFAKQGFEPDTYSSWCQKDGAAILTIDARTELPVAGPIRKPSDHALAGATSSMTHWGFITPSGSWYCGLFDDPDNPQYPSGAECASLGEAIPGQTANGPDGPETPATDVVMSENGTVETFFGGDGALAYTYEQSPLTLGYGEVLYARGGACTVDQQRGVTCTVPGHSFTVSLQRGLTTT